MFPWSLKAIPTMLETETSETFMALVNCKRWFLCHVAKYYKILQEIIWKLAFPWKKGSFIRDEASNFGPYITSNVIVHS